jgi:hypothetical protein
MLRRCLPALAVVALLTPLTAAADEARPDPDAAIEKYLAAAAARLSERVLDGATTLKEWEDRRARRREKYFSMLGLWPLPEKTPLQAKVTGTVERGDVAFEQPHDLSPEPRP